MSDRVQVLEQAIDKFLRSSDNLSIQAKWCALNDYDMRYLRKGLRKVCASQGLGWAEEEEGVYYLSNDVQVKAWKFVPLEVK